MELEPLHVPEGRNAERVPLEPDNLFMFESHCLQKRLLNYRRHECFFDKEHVLAGPEKSKINTLNGRAFWWLPFARYLTYDLRL